MFDSVKLKQHTCNQQ